MKIPISALLIDAPAELSGATSFPVTSPAQQQTVAQPATPRRDDHPLPTFFHTPSPRRQQQPTPSTPRHLFARSSPRTPGVTREDVERAVRVIGRGVKRGLLESPIYKGLKKLLKRVRGETDDVGRGDENGMFAEHPILGPPLSFAAGDGVHATSTSSRPAPTASTSSVLPPVSLHHFTPASSFRGSPRTPSTTKDAHPTYQPDDILACASECLAFAPPPLADAGSSFDLWSSASATYILDQSTAPRINRVTKISKIVKWPRGAFIEYPETCPEKGVLHIIPIDSRSYTNPLRDFAYSLSGDSHGQLPNQTCAVLVDRTGEVVNCTKVDRECASIKACSFCNLDELRTPHCFATRYDLEQRQAANRRVRSSGFSEANLLVEKTVAFFAALIQEGCTADEIEPESACRQEASMDVHGHQHLTDMSNARRRGQPKKATCSGRIVFGRDPHSGRPFVRCERYSETSRKHIVDFDRLENTDTRYLQALFEDDWEYIKKVESVAAQAGYGPLAECTWVDNFGTQRAFCPVPHRREPCSPLVLGEIRVLSPCHAKYTLYRPDNLAECPFIGVLCKGMHTHVTPLPQRTPRKIWHLLDDILMEMDWELADATPRRALRHGGVQAGLRQLLPGIIAPTFQHLHASLGNMDHVRIYIDQVKRREFPHGTGLEGVEAYKKRQDAQRRKEDLYIRRIFTYPRPESEGGGHYVFVVCMRPDQSWALLRALTWQIDTTFKRIIGWLEFEGAAYDHLQHRNVVYCRVFFNSQDHTAHRLLMHLIDSVVHEDTGSYLQWRHIDSPDLTSHVGIRLLIADEHKGEALGVGMYLCDICKERYPDRPDLHDANRLLQSLGPYEHLARIYRLCHVHFTRKLKEVSADYQEKQLMKSLSCVEHRDLEGTLTLLRNSSNVAVKNWLYDKEIGSPFALPGLCGERSLVPKEILRVYERDTNSNEASHSNANREGTKGTLLGGILRGERLDVLSAATAENERMTGIRRTGKGSSELLRQIHNAKRRNRRYTKALLSADKRIVQMNLTLEAARKKVAVRETNLANIQKGISSDKQIKQAQNQLSSAREELAKADAKARELQWSGSGAVVLELGNESDEEDDTTDDMLAEEGAIVPLWDQDNLFPDAEYQDTDIPPDGFEARASTPPPAPDAIVTRTGRVVKPRQIKDFVLNETPEKEREEAKEAQGRPQKRKARK